MGLSLAWLRRKRLEARLVAVEVSRIFAPPEEEQIAPDEMWQHLEAVSGGKAG